MHTYAHAHAQYSTNIHFKLRILPKYVIIIRYTSLAQLYNFTRRDDLRSYNNAPHCFLACPNKYDLRTLLNTNILMAMGLLNHILYMRCLQEIAQRLSMVILLVLQLWFPPLSLLPPHSLHARYWRVSSTGHTLWINWELVFMMDYVFCNEFVY